MDFKKTYELSNVLQYYADFTHSQELSEIRIQSDSRIGFLLHIYGKLLRVESYFLYKLVNINISVHVRNILKFNANQISTDKESKFQILDSVSRRQ